MYEYTSNEETEVLNMVSIKLVSKLVYLDFYICFLCLFDFYFHRTDGFFFFLRFSDSTDLVVSRRQPSFCGRYGRQHSEGLGNEHGSVCALLRDAGGRAGQTLQRHQPGIQSHQTGEPHQTTNSGTKKPKQDRNQTRLDKYCGFS